MKVLLTTGHCNPPLTRTICCDIVRYFSHVDELRMYLYYGTRRVLIASAVLDDWQKIVIVHEDGHEQIIKGA